jgi:hypothetical protein
MQVIISTRGMTVSRIYKDELTSVHSLRRRVRETRTRRPLRA